MGLRPGPGACRPGPRGGGDRGADRRGGRARAVPRTAQLGQAGRRRPDRHRRGADRPRVKAERIALRTLGA
ncbi:MAG: hypothetical protein B7Y99_12945 [Caulobacterales bacterium 32-69-10]|nr:MAG: hypothetical protein B7Y99_12945 [Caulobacterales bacterium 32-69-10]